jgi:hypothetical protein
MPTPPPPKQPDYGIVRQAEDAEKKLKIAKDLAEKEAKERKKRDEEIRKAVDESNRRKKEETSKQK